MGRWPTWLVVGALAVIAAVAVADALRGDGTRAAGNGAERAARAEPAAAGPRGTLLYSDARDQCRLHGVKLPTLRNAPAPKLRSCRFSLSPRGERALSGDAAWSPHGTLYAREVGGMIEVGSPYADGRLRFRGSAPAFRPDGRFTYVRAGDVVEWTTACPPGTKTFTLAGDRAVVRCERLALSSRDLRVALPEEARDRRVLLRDLAWLTPTRSVAVVEDASGPDAFVLVLEHGRPIVSMPLRAFGDGFRVEPSPLGSFFVTWLGDRFLFVRDRDGNAIAFPPLKDVHALAWSPDERWSAAAAERSIYLFRTNRDGTRVRQVPIEVRDLAWVG